MMHQGLKGIDEKGGEPKGLRSLESRDIHMTNLPPPSLKIGHGSLRADISKCVNTPAGLKPISYAERPESRDHLRNAGVIAKKGGTPCKA
jgi:hypothetical protein